MPTPRAKVLWTLALLVAVAGVTSAQSSDGFDLDDGNHSPLLKQGESWETDFPSAGVVTYHCMPHDTMPTMNARVIVSSTDPAAVERATVVIRNSTFEPATVVVKPGGVVNWTNLDTLEHDVMLTGFTPERTGEPKSALPMPGLLALAAALGAAALLLRRA